MLSWLLMLHVVVLGYWLGSELVINSTFRYVCYRGQLPFDERQQLMNHVMKVDQHVRYGLIFQATLGTLIGAKLGYFPGGDWLFWIALGIGAAWFLFIEAVHRLSATPLGALLARIDRISRYVLLLVIAGIVAGAIGDSWPLPSWLRWKLGAFAGVIASGVGIRLALLPVFKTWSEMRASGPTDQTNAQLKVGYWRATSVLVALWIFIGVVTYLSVVKPG